MIGIRLVRARLVGFVLVVRFAHADGLGIGGTGAKTILYRPSPGSVEGSAIGDPLHNFNLEASEPSFEGMRKRNSEF
jgi:hypothetical protein